MKTLPKAYKSLLFATSLLWFSHAIANGDPEVEKKKTYSKSYPLSANEHVTLDNKFGELKISTWDKNEIKVDVSITAKADEEQRAQEILDRISIEDGKSSDGVYFKTKFREHNHDDNDKGHHNEGMEINYMVYMPATSPLHADNQFGPMIVPDYKGSVNIISKFGSLTAGKLSNPKNVTVEFGKATIEELNGGELTIKFSKAQVNKLSGEADTHFEFCDKVKLNLDNDVKVLNLKNSYSTVYLEVDKNFSASYNVKTSFSEFKNKSNFTIKEEGDGEDDEDNHRSGFNHRYTGSSGSGAAKLKINSSFGNIILGHDLKVDMTSKKQDHEKEKKKTRNI